MRERSRTHWSRPSGKLPVLPCPQIAGFHLSTEGTHRNRTDHPRMQGAVIVRAACRHLYRPAGGPRSDVACVDGAVVQHHAMRNVVSVAEDHHLAPITRWIGRERLSAVLTNDVDRGGGGLRRGRTRTRRAATARRGEQADNRHDPKDDHAHAVSFRVMAVVRGPDERHRRSFVARAVPLEKSAQNAHFDRRRTQPIGGIQPRGLRIRDSGLLICDLRLLNRW
jgi:hypothetical protein